MKNFLDEEFLLDGAVASHLYHSYAEGKPIIDYHCHVSPKEIFEDRRFDNLVQVWLGGRNPDGTYFGDHYKWRLLRSNGIPEEEVTGDFPAIEKLRHLARTLELSIGNPMFTWCNLELKRFFGIDEPLNSRNVDEIVKTCDEKLRTDPSLTVRGIIRQSNVEFIGTTDDPTDSLEWHDKIKADKSFKTVVAPSFRPDKAINIEKPPFRAYIASLGKCVGRNLQSAEDVAAALVERLEFFKSRGCLASDHGLDYIPFVRASVDEADAAFKKAMAGGVLTRRESEAYQTYILLALGRAYAKNGVVMQLHYSCKRNANERMFKIEGPDSGFDYILQTDCGAAISDFLSALDAENSLPKTILYSLNPADNAMLGSLIGCFQGDETPGKIQHGTAWWFNDHIDGMTAQMRSLASLSVFGNFVGMLTDARSFLSYTRHELFRRILCRYVGSLVENGEYPNDEAALQKIVEGVSFRNAERYFAI